MKTMKTKILKSSAAAIGALALCLVTTACNKTRDGTANSSSGGSTAGSVANNDTSGSAASASTASNPAEANANKNASDSTGAAATLPAVNQNPPVSAVEIALMGDPALSSSAKAIQVSAENNKVVLRGSVPSTELKTKIEERAKAAANGMQIDNQITVSSQ